MYYPYGFNQCRLLYRPDKVILTASPSTGVTYLWSTGETTQSITVDIVGNYSVTAATSGGCSATAEMEVGRELVTNGNFTEGNVGFTSGYAYKPDSAGYNMELYDDTGNNAYGRYKWTKLSSILLW